jgi:hypothetical protein
MDSSMRMLPIAAALAVFGSVAVAQAGATKDYIGAYGSDAPNRAYGWPARAKVRPMQDAFAQARCAKLAPTYWTDQMPAGAYLNLR